MRIIITLAVTGVIAMIGMPTKAQPNKKAADARKEIASANKDLKDAKTDSAADFQKFRKESEIKIKDNQTRIAELKSKKSSESKDIKEKYDKKVLALEQRNNELKAKIKKADNMKTDRWTSFKREFNHDMEELGHSIKDFGVDNTK